jgi:Fe-S-cluster containining protein
MGRTKMPSLGCAGCGACCETLFTGATRGVLTAKLADPYVAGKWRKDYQFLYDHFIPTGLVFHNRVEQVCNVYDPVNKRCTDHENRPHTCRDFPFYGKEPRHVDHRYMQCSYWLDVPAALRPRSARPLIPLEVL